MAVAAVVAPAAPAALAASSAEKRILLRGVSWSTYELLIADQFGRRSPRFTYDRGLLEIMTTSAEHERCTQDLGQIVETVAEELDIDLWNLGQATFKRGDLAQGFEPDMCFFIRNEPHIRDTIEFDPATDPAPDIVIEVDISRDSLSRFPIYAGFGVPEVWRYRNRRVEVWRLDSDKYVESEASEMLPPLTREVLTRFLSESRSMKRTEWKRAIRAWVREQSASTKG
jgi:Uma2 family endonuclease